MLAALVPTMAIVVSVDGPTTPPPTRNGEPRLLSETTATSEVPSLQPIRTVSHGLERTLDFPDHGRLLNIEKRRRGPDAEARTILGLPKLLQPADSIFEDMNALSSGLRLLLTPGTAYPINFTRVFEAPDGSGNFVRGNGAVFMTYPYSVYKRPKDKGIEFQLPAGTTFHIGMPMAWRAVPPQPTESMELSPLRVRARVDGRINEAIDGRLDLRPGSNGESTATPHPTVIGVPEAPRVTPETMPPIVASEDYRRAFFDDLRAGK